ncbi:MAG: energy transducer TonB [Bacteroidaceae bacterium]|nr:energy transducer TonB [Bacteroidaceae bacterium]
MTDLLIYIAKAAVTLTLLYSLYGICLRRESFHSLNRAVLVTILIASVVMPFVHVATPFHSLFSWIINPKPTEGIIDYGAITAVPYLVDTPQTNEVALTSEPYSVSLTEVLFLIYIIGGAYFMFRYLLAIFRTVRTIRQSHKVTTESINGTHILVNSSLSNSCSWLNWVLLTPTDVEKRSILTHEQAHIRLRHSYDKMLCEIIVRLLWFVPFGWMLREDLSDIHEYEADRSVMDAGFDIEEYCKLLIHRATHINITPVVNSFNESKTKQRIARIFQPKSSRLSVLKAFYLLPLLAIAVVAVAGEKQKDEGYNLYVNTTTEEEPLIVINGKIIDIPTPSQPQTILQEYIESHLNIKPEDITHITVLKGETGKAIWGAKGTNGVIEIQTKKKAADEEPDHEVFVIAEESAEYPGGQEALHRYVNTNFHYPKIAQENGVQGRVNVEFIVEKDGSITNVKATKFDRFGRENDFDIIGYPGTTADGTNSEQKQTITQAEKILSASAVALVRNMPNWKPARQRGNIVRMKITLPISYRLQ